MPSDRLSLTQARLKEIVIYDPDTGEFTWRVPRKKCSVGARAGRPNAYGYTRICVDWNDYLAHRLAFLYMTGRFPAVGVDVDHINRIPNDNRWVNLRLASHGDNLANTGVQKNNTSGYRGVSWDRSKGKWTAAGYKHGKSVFLGRYADLEEAASVAEAWRKEHHGEFYSCPAPQETLSPNPES